MTIPTDGAARVPKFKQAVGVKVFARLRLVAEVLILSVVAYFVVETFVAQPYVVGQISMEPALLSGQSVLVDKLTPALGDLSRGDIVVFRPPPVSEFGDTLFVKRVVGLPGDVIQLRDGAVIVNGAVLAEPYAYDGAFGVGTGPESQTDRWTIAPATLFVMGDNRSNSIDSRSFGPISRGSVIGRAVLRFLPLDRLSVLQTPTYANVPGAP